MKNNTSFYIHIQNIKLKQKENSLGFILTLSLNKKNYDIELYGNRQILKGNKNQYQTIVDIVNNPGGNINFKMVNGKLFITLTCETPIHKTNSNYKKIVGIDINLKHSLIVTSEKDTGNIKGYINIYKELLQDNRFVNLLTNDELRIYQEMSNIITFCPFEYEFLLSRQIDNGYNEYEKVFTDVLYKLQKKLNTLKGNDKLQYQYVCCVNKLRQQYNAYFKLKNVYSQKQQNYDIMMGFYDENTESKQTMDERREKYPFRNTSEAINIINNLKKIQNTIDGCRKNIVIYAYKVFEQNNFDTIALENLENSNFEKIQVLPSIKSLLNYHSILNKTIDEAKTHKQIGNLISKDYYNFILDDNNKIIDASFSNKGLYRLKKSAFFNQAIKTIHFASIKNEFILLSNNGNMATVLVPHEYTSQMDSEKHVIYVTKNNNGKLVKVNKNRVRKTQESYINGLNADFNAANNIKYIIENENWRNIFCSQPKNYTKLGGYNLPQLEPTKKGQHNILSQLKKLNACEELIIQK